MTQGPSAPVPVPVPRRAGISSGRRRPAVALAFGVQGFIFISMTTHLPHVQEKFSLDSAVLSLILLGMVLLAGVGSVIAEALAGRLGSAFALRAGLVLVGLAVLGVGLAPTLELFCGALAVYGIGLGVVDAGTNMQGVDLEHHQGRALLPGFFAAWTCGGILATLASLMWGDVPLAVSIAPLAVFPLAAAVMLPRGGKPARGEAAGVVPAESDGQARTTPGTPWRRILLVGVVLVLFYMADTAASTWGPSFLHDLFGTRLSDVAIATLPYLVASLIARTAGDRLVARFGARTLLRAAAVVSAAGLLLVVAAPNALLAVAGFLILGLGAGLIAPLSFSAAGSLAGAALDSGERQMRVDAVIARFNQFNYVGALFGAVLTGLVGADSLRFGFAVPLILILLIWPLARVFPEKVR